MQQSIQLLRIDLKDGLFFTDQTFLNQIHRDFQCSSSRTFTVMRLKHKQFTALNGKFHILHIFIMMFQTVADINELIIRMRHDIFQFVNSLGSTDTGNDIFSLRIHQEFSIQFVFTGRRVTGKGNSGTAIIAHVTKYHHLNVDSRSPG